MQLPAWEEFNHISIHALREEGDAGRDRALHRPVDISIHALREEGDLVHAVTVMQDGISIHALREEGDRSWWPR